MLAFAGMVGAGSAAAQGVAISASDALAQDATAYAAVGGIAPDAALSPDPATGRLTVTAFLVAT